MKNRTKTGVALLLAVAMLMSFSATGLAATETLRPDFIYYLDDDGAYPVSSNSYYVSLSLNHSMLGMLPGDRQTLQAYMQAPTGVSAPIQWSSSNSNVVSVDENGHITAHRLGQAIITASVASLDVNCRVHVTLDKMYYDDIDNHVTVSGYLTGRELWEAGNRPNYDDSEPMPIRNWQGSWNSIISYFDSDAVAEALDDLASSGNNSDFVNDYNDTFAMDFPAMRFEGNVVTVYDSPLPGGPALYAYEYRAIDTADFEIGGSSVGTATIFRSINPNAPYRYLMMTPPQVYASYDTPMFFHIRYENDLNALKTYQDWSPIMVDAGATDDQVAQLLYQLADN